VESPSRLVYLDNNATTPVDPRVLSAMLPYFTEEFGNAASATHAFGWHAASAVKDSRTSIAEGIGAKSEREIVFTSGATESANLAIKGICATGQRGHIVTSSIEHKAVLETCKHLESDRLSVTYLPVDETGLIDLDQLSAAIREDTCLVTIMLANNEIGTVQNIRAIGAICREKGVLFHTDASQGVGRIPFSVGDMNVDLASFTAHKMYGPKGVGALYVSSETVGERAVAPLLDGGGHEYGRRSGTLNVPGIVGFATALRICLEEIDAEHERISGLRNMLYENLVGGLDGVRRNGHPVRCLPGLLNVCFEDVEAESVLFAMEGFALSAGSACTSANDEPSHVLLAIGLSEGQAQATIRFGIGRFNTESDIVAAADRCVTAVRELRAMNPSRFAPRPGTDQAAVNDSPANAGRRASTRAL
jgi:cysteine desulfurase